MCVFSSEKIVACVIGKIARDKGYHEIILKELLKFAGGKDKILKKFDNSEDVYVFLMKQQDKLVLALHKNGYSEVGEESNTVIMDWCDNNFLSKR